MFKGDAPLQYPAEVMGEGIRPYGPGKFDTVLDQLIWHVSLDGGADEEVGDVSEMGLWCGILRGDLTDSVLAVVRDEPHIAGFLTVDEYELLRCLVGAILCENDQGFVTVTLYSDSKELEKAWEDQAFDLLPSGDE